MARRPNYRQERADRDRKKAARRAEKEAARAEKAALAQARTADTEPAPEAGRTAGDAES